MATTTYGTCHFVSLAAAREYYKPYGYDNVAKAVARKLNEGEIKLGPPPLKPGQRATVDGREGRYIIETTEGAPDHE